MEKHAFPSRKPRLNREADDIEKSIKEVEAEEEARKETEEYGKLTAQERYEDEHCEEHVRVE